MYYTDHTTVYIPYTFNKTTVIPYPENGYNPKWGRYVKTIVRLRGLRSNPRKKFKVEKVAEGLLVTRIE